MLVERQRLDYGAMGREKSQGKMGHLTGPWRGAQNSFELCLKSGSLFLGP